VLCIRGGDDLRSIMRWLKKKKGRGGRAAEQKFDFVLVAVEAGALPALLCPAANTAVLTAQKYGKSGNYLANIGPNSGIHGSTAPEPTATLDIPRLSKPHNMGEAVNNSSEVLGQRWLSGLPEALPMRCTVIGERCEIHHSCNRYRYNI